MGPARCHGVVHRYILLLTALLVLPTWATADPATPAPLTWTVQPVTSLQKLTARTPGLLEPFIATPAQLHAARGEWECFQVVITAGSQPLHEISVSATSLITHLGHQISRENVQLYWENYVFVGHPAAMPASTGCGGPTP